MDTRQANRYMCGPGIDSVREVSESEGALARLLRDAGSEGLKHLLPELARSQDPMRRRLAAFHLGEKDAPEAIGLLLELLADPVPDVHLAAQDTLLEHGSQLVVEGVLALARDASAPARLRAIEVLSAVLESQGPLAVSRYRVPTEPIVAALIEGLYSTEEQVQLECIRALEKGGALSAPAVPHLAEVLAGAQVRVRARAVAALSAIGTEDARFLLEEVALPLVLDDLRHPDMSLQCEAAHAARHLGEGAVLGLVEALRSAGDSLRFEIALTLRRIEAEERVLEAIQELLKTGSKQARRNALCTLQDIGTPLALDVVRQVKETAAESAEDRLLRTMEAWARRSTTSRALGYRLNYGELTRVDGRRLHSPADRRVAQLCERAILSIGDRLSRAESWDVTLEEEQNLIGLVLRPRASVEMPRNDRTAPVEVVFDRASLKVVLVIGVP